MLKPVIEKFLGHPYVRMVERGDIVSFHYTESCTYDRAWDEVTRAARGIIFNRKTGELLARPWEKFFNVGEMPEVSLDKLLTLNEFYASQKMDGSLGILYFDREYFITTKGSLDSEQGRWATEWARTHIRYEALNDEFTYLFEIIYPSNKIVVDYKGKEGLILLGCVNKETGIERTPGELVEIAFAINVECVHYVVFENLEQVISTCTSLVGEEGFVVTFPSTGLKAKVKGDWYKKIHKIVSCLTPLAFWEAWDLESKVVNKEYLKMVPEEFREFSDNLANLINKLHINEFMRLNEIYYDVMRRIFCGGIKEFAIDCQKNHKKDLGGLICLYKKEIEKLWEGIHKRVRPTGNKLVGYGEVRGGDFNRINRILEDG